MCIPAWRLRGAYTSPIQCDMIKRQMALASIPNSLLSVEPTVVRRTNRRTIGRQPEDKSNPRGRAHVIKSVYVCNVCLSVWILFGSQKMTIVGGCGRTRGKGTEGKEGNDATQSVSQSSPLIQHSQTSLIIKQIDALRFNWRQVE